MKEIQGRIAMGTFNEIVYISCQTIMELLSSFDGLFFFFFFLPEWEHIRSIEWPIYSFGIRY